MIRFFCPQCGKRCKAAPEFLGRRAKCPRCGSKLVIPGDSNSAPRTDTANAGIEEIPEADYSVQPRRLMIAAIACALTMMVVVVTLLFGFAVLQAPQRPTASQLAHKVQTSASEPHTEPKSEPKVESKPKAEPKVESKPKTEPKVEPKPLPQLVDTFHKLAYRLSFSYYWREEIINYAAIGPWPELQGTPEPTAQRLFIPYRSRYLFNPGSGIREAESYVRLVDMELDSFAPLLKVGDQKLREVAEESRRLFLLRSFLYIFNEYFGLTPSSSIRIGKAAIWRRAWRDVQQRDEDRNDFKNAQQTADAILDSIEDAASRSAVVKYADMEAVDRAAELWRRSLLPWTKKTAGPIVAGNLISVQPKWECHSLIKQRFDTPVGFQGLHHLSITNVSGKNLTHVVVEAQLSNEWKDKAANYYYISELKAGSTCHLMLHPRWVTRRIYSRDMTLNYSIWALENSNADSTMTIKNPYPAPDAEEYRNNILNWDNGNLGKKGSSLAKIIPSQ